MQIVNRKSPGKLDAWTAWVIAGACFVTFIGVTVGVDLVFKQIDRAVERGWVPFGLTFITAFCMFAAWLPPAKLSRSLRVAVMLPVIHALIVGLAWPAWDTLARYVNDHDAACSLSTQFPIALAAAVTLATFVAFSLLVARRRSGEWLHGLTMLALSELLLLGLWLPLSCAFWQGGNGRWWGSDEPLVAQGALAARVLFSVAPPTLVALGFTAFALRRPTSLLRQRGVVMLVVIAMFVLSVGVRLGASARSMLLYSNLMPMLLTAMIVAISALLIVGVANAIRSYAAHRVFATKKRADGVIVPDDSEPAAGVQIMGWLRGPRLVQRPFAVSIAGATIPVRGAHIVASLPPAITQLRVGESYAVLRPGDRVTIAGHAAASGDPFRTSAAPLAGELFVAPADRASSGFSHVALAMWRPCVAYLLIVVAVAVPALAALAAA